MIIGISGYARSGKSTLANILESEFGYRRKHIATPLRNMLAELLKANGLTKDEIWAYLEGPLKEEIIPELGVTSREAQITLGTEWGRNLINQDLWVNIWARGLSKNNLILNDSVRFPNEAKKIWELGGCVIRITRPGIGPAKFTSPFGRLAYEACGAMWGVHPSERIDRIACDYEIENDGHINDLFDDLNNILVNERQFKTLIAAQRKSMVAA